MSRVFAYCRVSTLDQETQNQVLEIESAGFRIQNNRIIKEHISGSILSEKRPEFMKLLDRLEHGDVLVVTKLDRLGRNAMDVRKTIDRLTDIGVRVHCLALGGVDLTSPAGKMTMQVIAAVAEFERDLILERTKAGLERAKASGKKLGRKPSLNDQERKEIAESLHFGTTVAHLAREYKTTRQTILRIRKNNVPVEAG